MLTKHLNLEFAPLTDTIDRYSVDRNGHVHDKLVGEYVKFTKVKEDDDFGSEVAEIYYKDKYRTLSRRWIAAMAFKPLFKLDEDIFNWDVLIAPMKKFGERTFVGSLIWKPPAGGQPCPGKPGYNVIPGFSAYAINKDGESYSRFTGIPTVSRPTYSRIGDRVRAPDNFYLNINVRTDSLHPTVLGVHRAIMLAFSEFDERVNSMTVNHKNGRKRDNYFDNLEWATHSVNNNHAITHAFRDIGDQVLVKDYLTGTITKYRSMAALARKLKVSRNSLKASLVRIGGLIQGRYAAKLLESEEPWPDYTSEEVEKVQAEYEDWKLNLRCMARCIKTDAFIHAPTPTRLGNEVGMPAAAIVARLKSKNRWPCNGFEFYYYRDGAPDFLRTYTEKEKEFFSEREAPRVPVALYPEDDRSDFTLFATVRDLAKHLDVPESSVHTLLKTSNVFPTSKLGKSDQLIVERLVYENNL